MRCFLFTAAFKAPPPCWQRPSRLSLSPQMSRLTSNSRWRGPQALGSVASGHNANRSEGGAEVHSTRGGSNSKWLSPAGPSAPLGAALGQPHHSYQQVNHTSRQRRPAAMVDSHASHEVDLGLVDLAPLSESWTRSFYWRR